MQFITEEPEFQSESNGSHNGESVVLDRDLTLGDLAARKRISIPFLRSLGVETLPGGYRSSVEISYRQIDGYPARTRYRDGGGPWWRSPDKRHAYFNRRERRIEILSNLPITVYGAWRLSTYHRAAYLVIVEGETDCWAAWSHGVPCLGVPGVDLVNVLELEHVERFKTIYVFQEPDKAGRGFPGKVANQLAKLGYQGELKAISLEHVKAKNGNGHCKDLSDLHILSPMRFAQRLGQAIRTSRSVSPSHPTKPAAANNADQKMASPASYPSGDEYDKNLFLDGVDLESVITMEQGAPLRNGRWVCQFHGGEKANLSVFEKNGRQYFKCHSGSCGKSGDAAKYIMELRGHAFPEALKHLGFQQSPRYRGVREVSESSQFGGVKVGLSLTENKDRDKATCAPPKELRRYDTRTPQQKKNSESRDEPENSTSDTWRNFQPIISRCRRVKLPMRDTSHHDTKRIFGFPCHRRAGCDLCSPLWEYNRSKWYSLLVADWNEVHGMLAVDSHHADLAITSISRRYRKGQTALYIRVPTPHGIVVISSVPHNRSELLTKEDAQTVLRRAVTWAMNTTGKITATKSIRFEETRVKGQIDWEYDHDIANHPLYNPRDSMNEIKAKFSRDPTYEQVWLRESDHCSTIVMRKTTTELIQAAADFEEEPSERQQQHHLDKIAWS